MRYFILLSLLLTSIAFGQDCDCKQDLDAYFTQAQELISYQRGMSKDQQAALAQRHQELVANLSCEESVMECFLKVADLNSIIPDEHARLYSRSGVRLSADSPVDEVARFRESAFYQSIPKLTEEELNTLEQGMAQVPAASKEGIYYTDGNRVAVTETADGRFAFYALDPIGLRQPGELMAMNTQLDGTRHNIVYVTGSYSSLVQASYQHYDSGYWTLYNMHKDKNASFPYLPSRPDENYWMKTLLDDVTYVRFGSFSGSDENVSEAKAFIKQIAEIETPYLIMDFRNNTGGTWSISKPLKKVLKKLLKKKKTYVMVNYLSGSNGETTPHEIRDYGEVYIVGKPTMGAIGYGTNYGTVVSLPSERISYTLTDMYFKKFVQYESQGIPLDHELSLDRDWIEQVLEMMK